MKRTADQQQSFPDVQLRHLVFTWPGQNHAVIDFEKLDIDRGQSLFLRGASGTGKTTLLSLIAAVIRPQSGSISIAGTDLETLKGGKRDRFRADNIGLVFQQFNLLPFLSVVENVELSCRFSLSRLSRATAGGLSLREESERLLSRMLLPAELFNRSVMTLSVGQQQRVAVARALLGSPPLVIADEPTSALDKQAQLSFLRLLFEEVKETGATLLFVSHDESLSEGFDRQLDLSSINRSRAHSRQEGQ